MLLLQLQCKVSRCRDSGAGMNKYKIKSDDVYLQVFASRTPSDIAILFLHGGPGDGAWSLIMQQAMQKLSSMYRCIFFDQRGCGLSMYPLEKGIRYEDIMHDIEVCALDIHERYHPEKLLLFGDSEGGYFSLLCMECYPELFDGMILSSPLLLLGANEEQTMFEYIKQQYLDTKNLQIQKLMNILKDEPPQTFFANRHVHQMIFGKHNTSIQLQYVAAISAWLFDKPCAESLHQTTIPTLIMKGKDDAITSEQRILDTLIRLQNPFIVYETFPDCGHAIYVDQPDVFINRIHEFIEEEFVCE